MKYAIRSLVVWLMALLGINALFRFLNRNKALIVWYHGICDDDFSLLKGYQERHISRSTFRRHLEFLTRKGYAFATMTELMDRLAGRRSLRKLVVLTFDDGFRNTVRNAYPLMKEFSARGCVYAVTDLIGTGNLLWTDYVETALRSADGDSFTFRLKDQVFTYPLGTRRLREQAMLAIKRRLWVLTNEERAEHMRQFGPLRDEDIPDEFRFADWDELRSLDPAVLEVGSHTRTHVNCTSLSADDDFRREIEESKAEIERRIGREVTHFAYPGGHFDDNVLRWTIGAGYRSAVSVIAGFSDWTSNPHILLRMSTNEDYLLFKATVSGSYQLVTWITGLLRGRR